MTDEEKEQDRKKKIERANAYREMMNLWAWKDLMKMIDDIRQQTLLQCLHSKELAQVFEAKGKCMGLDAIASEMNYVLGSAESAL